LKAAAIENPRLITALTAVISAQKRNGMLIQDAKGVDAPSQDTAASDYQVENSVATSDVGTLEHPAMCARLRSRLSALRALPEAMCDLEVCIMLFLVASMPRSERPSEPANAK
jgi:hypothetical protein